MPFLCGRAAQLERLVPQEPTGLIGDPENIRVLHRSPGLKDQEAERLYEPHIDYFFNRCLHVYAGFADAPGYRTQATLKAGFVPQVGGAATAMRATLRWKDFVEHGFVIAGSAATVRETLREALTSMRVGHLMVLLQIGSLPDALTRENTERFARDVMPSLKDLWSEYEDHWYPASWTQQEGRV